MKMFNAAIAYSREDGTVGISLTNDLNNRLLKFNQQAHPVFKTFSVINQMTKEQLVEYLLQDEFFINNDSFAFALKSKIKKKIVKTNVADILSAFKEQTSELV